MDIIFLISGFITGIVIGVLLGIWWMKSKTQERTQALVDAQIQSIENLASGKLILLEQNLAKAEQKRLGDFEQDNKQAASQLTDSERRGMRLNIELEKRNTEFEGLQKKVEQREEDFTKLSVQFKDQFENLANKIFEDKSKSISQQNKVQLESVLNPLKEKIIQFEKQIIDSNQKSTEAGTLLKEQIRQLTSLNSQMLEDARNLTHALKGDSKVQGNWGEMILEKVLEKSGLTKGREYHVQQHAITEDGRRLQPDVVVDLPDARKVIIDSKVSLTAYERYQSAKNDEERELHCKAHLNSIRTHIKGLSGKNYDSIYGIKSPDFVLLFIPIEPAFSLAVKEDESLYMNAFEYNIVIVTPSTLLASLSTISTLWKQEYQNRNVMAIAKQAGSLYDKFFGLYNDLTLLGRNLNTAQKTYDATMNKLKIGNGNLIGQVEKIKILGAQSKKHLPREVLDQAVEDGEMHFEE
ncbi:MAG: DNA recombination protein RmuC [Limisphaerales bacterium]|jgi:DNA recombination protein RmuC